MRELFTSHPSSVGETYLQHQRAAFGFGIRLLIGGLACLAHGVFPFLCQRTGSRLVSDLHDEMLVHRGRRAAPQAKAASRTNG